MEEILFYFGACALMITLGGMIFSKILFLLGVILLLKGCFKFLTYFTQAIFNKGA